MDLKTENGLGHGSKGLTGLDSKNPIRSSLEKCMLLYKLGTCLTTKLISKGVGPVGPFTPNKNPRATQ